MKHSECDITATITIDEPFSIELKNRVCVPENSSADQIITLAHRALQTAKTRLSWQLDLRLEISINADEPLVIAELSINEILGDTAVFQTMSIQASEMIWDKKPQKVIDTCSRNCLKAFSNLIKKHSV